MGAIDVSHLSKHFGDVVAVDDLSFSVEEGEIFGYLGPNGAGKTTTIRTLLGYQKPTAGTARVLGADIRDSGALTRTKAHIGYLPSSPSFDERATGATYLDFHASLKGDERRAELLDMFDPPLGRKIGTYSTGNKQMLGIVQTFMHDPELVIMDEPTAGLDPIKQERFNQFLREERDRGTTIVFSSHILGEVRRVCDRVGFIRDGHLVTLEDIETLLERGGKLVRVNTATPLDPETADLGGVVNFEQADREAQFTFTGDYNELLALLADYDVVDLDVGEPPLEDVFMHYYGESDV
ncbi:ABC-2 type transport system ATP-binding protein [Halogranum rubrum]|uniref:ABC-2 type transport system ATP-binding protein n=1 Tax=Halogranum rubrum TaxID=553466 RepID=A0A1I4BKS9_9EURY|nr:ABC transporter ATP-binding protein [Halogranum rubrum]SFK69472.1 ABC-2 type transport system ATP-binding protein [Halogranum rubrum]